MNRRVLAGAAIAWALASACTSASARLPLRVIVKPDRPATSNDLSNPQAANTPKLASDPAEPRFVALANRVDGPDFSCALQVSGDAGRTFIPVGPVPNLPTGAEKCYAPEVAFDGRGTLYYLFVGLHTAGNSPVGAYLTTSTDRGRTFSPPLQVLGANNFAVRMAIDPSVGRRGRLHLVWLHANAEPGIGSLPAPPNPILAAYSDDGGQSFSPPVQVSDPNRELVVAPSLTLGPHHSVHIAYYDLGNDQIDYHGLEGATWQGNWSILLATSADGGRRFGPGAVVDDHVVPPERVMLIFTMPPPSIAADGKGRVFVAWYDARNGDWDAFLRRSTDAGKSWEPVHRLNDDPVGNASHQYQPQLNVAPDGRIDAVFYDRRNDPANLSNDVFFTFSSDGGASFAPNTKLDSEASLSSSGPTYGGPAAVGLVEFGTHLGLLSSAHGAVAAWTDTRNSFNPDVQGVFTAQLELAGR